MRHNTKGAERQNPSFPKELIENADFYKPVLNKIMTTHEQCVKYNFVAPFTELITYHFTTAFFLHVLTRFKAFAKTTS